MSEVDDHFFTRQLSHLQTTSVHDGYGDEVPELLLSEHEKVLLHVLGNFVQIAVFVPWAEMFSLPLPPAHSCCLPWFNQYLW